MGLLRDSLTSPSRHGCTCAAPHNFGETDWPQPPRSRLSSDLHTEQQPEKPQLRRDDAVERDRGCSGRAAPSRCQVFALLGFLQRFDIPVSSRRPAVWKPALRTHTCVSRPAPPPTSGSQGSHVTPCPTGTLTLTRPRVTHHLPTTTRGCCSPSCCQRMPAPPAPAHPVPSLSQCPHHTHVRTHTHMHTHDLEPRPAFPGSLPSSFALYPPSKGTSQRVLLRLTILQPLRSPTEEEARRTRPWRPGPPSTAAIPALVLAAPMPRVPDKPPDPLLPGRRVSS